MCSRRCCFQFVDTCRIIFFGLSCLLSVVSSESANFERCGIGPVLTSRIVGGNETEPNKWPWQASLMLTHPQYGKVGHWCGAVIIHKQWVMTAAHCILNPLFSLPQPVFWKVRVGEHNLKLTEGPEKTIQVSEVHFHPWYHAYDKDIALLKLEKELEFNDYVRAICLPDEDAGYLGMRCVATGWGKIDFDKRGSNVLREVEIQVLDNMVCHNAYYPTYKIPIKGWHLCAGVLEGGKGTCQGDSGGPLQCLVNGQYYVAGITSFGSGCAKEGFPDIYTNTAYFADWVKEIMSRPSAKK
ncbi:trypsin-2-like [Stegodyphus dumicola]|uniref:trypsin-2-like n=1 Tax=Stegodyphus dumicola TaxID=202533 RepID=UPI0015A8FB12|nr:trypsin-2-like [Stegodyphus dumicola]